MKVFFGTGRFLFQSFDGTINTFSSTSTKWITINTFSSISTKWITINTTSSTYTTFARIYTKQEEKQGLEQNGRIFFEYDSDYAQQRFMTRPNSGPTSTANNSFASLIVAELETLPESEKRSRKQRILQILYESYNAWL